MSDDNENTKAGYQSLAFFCGSALIFCCVFFTEIFLVPNEWSTRFWSPVLYFSAINIFLKLYFSGFSYAVLVRATFLGFVFACGIFVTNFDDGRRLFGIYLAVLAFFHFSEFFTTAVTNPNTLTISSYILNHSPQYNIANLACMLEWAIESYFFPEMKLYFHLSSIGLIMCIGGEIMRKSAMCTAKTNFNHHVQFVKNKDHILIKHGIYSLFRHPSYVGWFYWAIGTQVILLNPFCFVAFTIASWMYFNERIYFEEYALLNFFGEDYQTYQKTVSTGLPFIEGYIA